MGIFPEKNEHAHFVRIREWNIGQNKKNILSLPLQ